MILLNLRSKVFLVLLIIALLSSFAGLVFVFGLLAIVFVCFPFLYKYATVVPKKLLEFLLLHKNLCRILGLIPGSRFEGQWIMEGVAQTKQLTNINHLVAFLLKNWNLYLIIHPAFIAICINGE